MLVALPESAKTTAVEELVEPETPVAAAHPRVHR